MRKNPRHADAVLVSIENTYQLPYRQTPVARYVVVPGPRKLRPDVKDLIIQAVMTSTNMAGVERDAQMLPSGHYTVYEMLNQKVVGANSLEVP